MAKKANVPPCSWSPSIQRIRCARVAWAPKKAWHLMTWGSRWSKQRENCQHIICMYSPLYLNFSTNWLFLGCCIKRHFGTMQSFWKIYSTEMKLSAWIPEIPGEELRFMQLPQILVLDACESWLKPEPILMHAWGREGKVKKHRVLKESWTPTFLEWIRFWFWNPNT